MALELTNFTIVEVSKPNIGEKSPSSVRADFTVTLPKRTDIRREWEGLLFSPYFVNQDIRKFTKDLSIECFACLFGMHSLIHLMRFRLKKARRLFFCDCATNKTCGHQVHGQSAFHRTNGSGSRQRV